MGFIVMVYFNFPRLTQCDIQIAPQFIANPENTSGAKYLAAKKVIIQNLDCNHLFRMSP